MEIENLITVLMKEIHKISRTDTVVGRPIEVGQTHVVPVCDLSIGFGTGGVGGKGGVVSRRRFKGEADGGGAGGGIGITPVAFIVVDPEGRAELQALKHKKTSAITKAIDLIPKLTDKILTDKGEEEKARPKLPEGKRKKDK